MNGEAIMWSPGVSLDAIEKMVILKAYAFFRNNKTATANSLKISIRTLDNKLERYEVEEKIEQERLANEQLKERELLARARGNPPNNIGIPYSPISHAQATAQSNFGPNARIQMESITNAPEKQSLPLSERQEVQTMLSKHSSTNGKGKGR